MNAEERTNEVMATWRGETSESSRKLEDLIADAIKDAEQVAYRAGQKRGICRYAWWKDGVEYVGTCRTPLAKALEQLEREQ